MRLKEVQDNFRLPKETFLEILDAAIAAQGQSARVQIHKSIAYLCLKEVLYNEIRDEEEYFFKKAEE